MGAALFSQHGGYRGRGHWHSRRGGRGGRGGGGHGGRSGTRDNHESKYTYCKIDSHTPDACRKHNALWREETMETMSAFASSADSKATSMLIASLTNISRSGGEGRERWLQQLLVRPETAILSD
jgi:hypothetical protein